MRIVPDEEDEIVAAVNALRARYDYVFTTGGIGPTHDDITADSIAKAFGVPCDYDDKAYALLDAHLCQARAWSSPTRASAWRACRAAPTTSTIRSRVAPGLPHRQRPCHGRRAVDLPGDARQCRADAEDRHEAAVGHRRLPATAKA